MLTQTTETHQETHKIRPFFRNPIRHDAFDPLNASPGRPRISWTRCSDPHHVSVGMQRIPSRLLPIRPSRSMTSVTKPAQRSAHQNRRNMMTRQNQRAAIRSPLLSNQPAIICSQDCPRSVSGVDHWMICDTRRALQICIPDIPPTPKHLPSREISSPEFSNEFRQLSQAEDHFMSDDWCFPVQPRWRNLSIRSWIRIRIRILTEADLLRSQGLIQGRPRECENDSNCYIPNWKPSQWIVILFCLVLPCLFQSNRSSSHTWSMSKILCLDLPGPSKDVDRDSL
jgi:hypothetical protein